MPSPSSSTRKYGSAWVNAAPKWRLSQLDSAPVLCHRPAVTVARISELDRKTTQSGKANSGRWLLEFERSEPLRPDPLTGWAGSGDTNPQVRINFDSKEAAIAYAQRHGL